MYSNNVSCLNCIFTTFTFFHSIESNLAQVVINTQCYTILKAEVKDESNSSATLQAFAPCMNNIDLEAYRKYIEKILCIKFSEEMHKWIQY